VLPHARRRAPSHAWDPQPRLHGLACEQNRHGTAPHRMEWHGVGFIVPKDQYARKLPETFGRARPWDSQYREIGKDVREHGRLRPTECDERPAILHVNFHLRASEAARPSKPPPRHGGAKIRSARNPIAKSPLARTEYCGCTRARRGPRGVSPEWRRIGKRGAACERCKTPRRRGLAPQAFRGKPAKRWTEATWVDIVVSKWSGLLASMGSYTADAYLNASRYGCTAGHIVAVICAGTGLNPATSAPGLGSPLSHLHRDWARPCHICAGTWRTALIGAHRLLVAPPLIRTAHRELFRVPRLGDLRGAGRGLSVTGKWRGP
jgi:hypothetical protein